jgi:hypothetical protein
MRRAGKRDGPQKAIVDALRKAGTCVEISNQEGWPDLVCYNARRGTKFLECKSHRGKLTADQKQFTIPFTVVYDEREALLAMGYEFS